MILFILFLTFSIYSRDYWFMMPTLGVLLGYFIAWYPILFTKQKDYLSEEKYNKLKRAFLLSYSSGILLLLILLLVSIYAYKPFNLGVGIIISSGILIIPIVIGLFNFIFESNKVQKIVIVSLVGLFIVGFSASIVTTINLIKTQETNTYNIETNYKSIDIKLDTSDVNIYLSTNIKLYYVFINKT